MGLEGRYPVCLVIISVMRIIRVREVCLDILDREVEDRDKWQEGLRMQDLRPDQGRVFNLSHLRPRQGQEVRCQLDHSQEQVKVHRCQGTLRISVWDNHSLRLRVWL